MVQGQHSPFMPVYIGICGDLVGCHCCLTHSLTHRQQNIELSLKFKLSQAMPLNCNDNSNALIIDFRSLFDIKGKLCSCDRSIILTLSDVIGDLN